MSELRGPREHDDLPPPEQPPQPERPDRPERPERAEPTDLPEAPSTEDGRSIRDAYVDDPDDIFDTPALDRRPESPEEPESPGGRGRLPDRDAARPGNDVTATPATQTPADSDVGAPGSTANTERADGAGAVDDRPTVDVGVGVDRELSDLERDHPDVGSVVRRLVADRERPLDLTEALADPPRRGETVATIRELAAGRLLGDSGDLQEYRRGSPGEGPLFEQVPREVNRTVDGVSRKDSYLARCEDADAARGIGGLPDGRQQGLVDGYARRLAVTVQPLVLTEVEKLAASIPDATVSTRVKNADGILDKVGRMTAGTEARPPRDDYRVGDVVDAVGARITVADTTQLAELLGSVCEELGTGDGGRVLELDNMYAAPKPNNPSYRVIPVLVAIEADGQPYTYELQLTTRRASVAADLEHNTIYKPSGESSSREQDAVRRMLAEAAALDQEETRAPDRPDDQTRTGGTR